MTEYAWSERGEPTSLSAAAAAEVLADAHEAKDGKRPPLTLAELELAHVWIETELSKKMWRYNWGNLAAGGFFDGIERITWPGDIWRPPWYALEPDASERLKAVHERMLAGKAPSAFRAGSSHAEGARWYLDLVEQPRFAAMLRAGRTGSPTAYAQAVYDTGYCRDAGCKPDKLGPKLDQLVAGFRRDGVFDGLGLRRPSGGLDAVGLVAMLLLAKELLS